MNFRDLLPFLPISRPRPPRRRSAVVALGGGGARGLAHLGALEAIMQTEIRPERFVGVSIGALIGAICAMDTDVRRIHSRVIGFLTSADFRRHQEQLFGSTGVSDENRSSGVMAWYDRAKYLYSAHRRLTRAVTQQSLMPGLVLSTSIAELVPDIEFSDLSIPLSIVAADLRSGHSVVLESGSIRTAIQASMSLPGIFPPVEHNGMLLCDIGVIDSIPSSVASAYGTDMTIAIDIGQHNARIERFDSALEVMMRMQDIGEQILRREKSQWADIHIRPDLAEVAWFDFRHPERLIDRGREAAWQQLTRHGFHRVEQTPQEQTDAKCG